MCSYDLAHPSAARYPVEHFPGQNLPDFGGFDSLQYLITKRVHHQRPRCCLVYAPRSHIKDGFLVDMADRRSVAALDVVGQYLELGLGINLGVRRQQQVLVALLRVSLLCVFSDNYGTIENACRPAGENPLVILPAAAVRPGMVDQGVVVDMLSVSLDIQPIKLAISALAVEDDCDVVPDKVPSDSRRIRTKAAV